MNVPVVAPAATAALGGTTADGLLLERLTVAPPVEAGALRVTVPVELAPPTTLAGFRVTDDRLGAEVTVRVTVIVAGDPWAPDEVTVTCPVYAPCARPLTFTETVRVCGVLPLAGAALSHVLSLATVKASSPVPEFVTFTVPDAGLAPP